MVSNHVFDLLAKHDKTTLPTRSSTSSSVEREQYDYSEHSRVGAEHGQQVSDEACSASAVGTPDQHVEKLRQLEAADVEQWNIYLMTSGQEEPSTFTAGHHPEAQLVVKRTPLVVLGALLLTAPASSHSLARNAGIVWGADDGIYGSDVDGSDTHLITRCDKGGFPTDYFDSPSWSPSGRRLGESHHSKRDRLDPGRPPGDRHRADAAAGCRLQPGADVVAG